MTTAAGSFPSGDRYEPIDLSVGTVLPSKTFISGRLVLLWSLAKNHAHHLRFKISAKYQANISASDYVSAASIEQETWMFIINLTPSMRAATSSGQTLEEALMAEFERLKRYMAAEVKIVADGLKIVAVDGKEVTLEAAGSRTLWTEKVGAWTVFQDPTQSSATPSWLGSDSSFPSPAGPSTRPPAQAGPSNYRPISSHLPPALNLRPSNEPSKRRRSPSPEKRPQDPLFEVREPPLKRALLVTRETPSTFGPRTFDPPRRTSSRAFGPNLVQNRRDSDHDNQTPLPHPPKLPVTDQQADPPGDTSTDLDPPDLANPATRPPDHHFIERVAPIPEQSTAPTQPPKSATPTTALGRVDSAASLSRSISPDKGRAMRRAALAEAGQAPNQPRTARDQAEARARDEARVMLEKRRIVAERKREEGLVLHRGLELPDIEYRAIKDLRSGATASIMGIVASTTPPKPPIGARKDYLMSVAVSDPSSYHEGGSSSVDLVVTMFRRTAGELPIDIQPGMPILFRHLRLNSFNDKVKGNAYTSGSNTWAFVAEDGTLKHADIQLMSPPISRSEVDRLMDLSEWWNKVAQGGSSKGDVTPSASTSAQASRKAMLLGDAGHRDFFDTTFKILHVELGRTVHFELYVTDGTISTSQPRNFHGVSAKGIHDRAIFCVSIQREPAQSELPMFQVGKYIHLKNVRAKFYKQELEMIWSELCLEDQAARGWNNRKASSVPSDDPQAKAIEQRLAEMERALLGGIVPRRTIKEEDPNDRHTRPMTRTPSGANLVEELPVSVSHAQSATTAPGTSMAAAAVPRLYPDLATHLFTAFKDPVNHPESTIADILSNRTFPNRYRVKARVIVIHARGMTGKATLAQRHCGHCHQAIKKYFCLSCQDVNMRKASWQYRFLAILQEVQNGATLPILISGAEAEKFLPALPPISASTNPNDIKKTIRQIEETTKKVEGVLQGGMMDGVRPVPLIDWTLESTIVTVPKGYGGPNGDKGVVVYKPFGMSTY